MTTLLIETFNTYIVSNDSNEKSFEIISNQNYCKQTKTNSNRSFFFVTLTIKSANVSFYYMF